jgi:hypothetical protein
MPENTTTHTKKCLARAIIAAVENARDALDTFDFRIYAQENRFLADADGYLADALMDCVCGEREVDWLKDLFVSDPDEAQRLADKYLRDHKISPEQYVRLARWCHTR